MHCLFFFNITVNPIDKNHITKAKTDFKSNKKAVLNLKRKKPNEVDLLFHSKHEQEFKKMDCLTCANCCKTTSPIFREADIRRISKHLRVKESQLITNFLRMDEDGDWVLKTSPCAFLQADNTCSIYEVRPLACREYPHTDRKNMFQILELTINNSLICPVVSRIISEISNESKLK